MRHLLTDEDLPRSTARVLKQAGHDATDVRDVGLSGHSDADVFAYAVAHSMVLLTRDKGFANPLVHPELDHPGIVIIRLPNELPVSAINEAIIRAVSSLASVDLSGGIAVVGPDRVRLRYRSARPWS